MPEGARAAKLGCRNTAPALDRLSASAYLTLLRKLSWRGPAVSSGATSANVKAVLAAPPISAPVAAAISATVNGPTARKNRGSAIGYFFLPVLAAVVGAVGRPS